MSGKSERLIMNDWPDRASDGRVSLTRIRGEAVDAPWLAEAAQAIAGRSEPCPLNARLAAGDAAAHAAHSAHAAWWIRAEIDGERQIVGALSGQIAGARAVWTWLAVAAEWRHYGFGGAAVPLFERAARRLGAIQALAPLPRDNGVALYFWLRLGYVPQRAPALDYALDEAELPPGIAPDAVWMRRPLSRA